MNEPYNWHDIARKAMHFSVTWATEDDEQSTKLQGLCYVCGRLKIPYRYSTDIVYNNFPFPEAAAVKAVEEVAQGVLDLRKTLQSTGKSLADLYDPLKMPAELLAAHHRLDLAVDACYGIKKGFGNEAGRVGWLFGRWGEVKR